MGREQRAFRVGHLLASRPHQHQLKSKSRDVSSVVLVKWVLGSWLLAVRRCPSHKTPLQPSLLEEQQRQRCCSGLLYQELLTVSTTLAARQGCRTLLDSFTSGKRWAAAQNLATVFTLSPTLFNQYIWLLKIANKTCPEINIQPRWPLMLQVNSLTAPATTFCWDQYSP